jgi:hypothetical protein
MHNLLVIIRDLHLVGIASIPAEADAPLLVYPDAVVSSTLARELLKPIPWG